MTLVKLTRTILNSTEVQEALKTNIPQIAKLHSLDWLEDLRLITLSIGEHLDEIEINYHATTPPDFYPDIMTRIKHEIPNSFISVVEKHDNKYKSLSFRFSNKKIAGRLFIQSYP